MTREEDMLALSRSCRDFLERHPERGVLESLISGLARELDFRAREVPTKRDSKTFAATRPEETTTEAGEAFRAATEKLEHYHSCVGPRPDGGHAHHICRCACGAINDGGQAWTRAG